MTTPDAALRAPQGTATSPAATATVLPLVRSTAAALHLPRHSLVVVAGLPGAGKTTLVRRLTGSEGVQALDSEDIAAHLAALPVPYGVLRPLVHAAHLAHVVAELWSRSPVVLTSDPLTSPLRRSVLRTAARLAGRQLHVVLVHASPAQARDGQQRRGRRLSARRTTRHEVRYVQWLRTALGTDVDVVLSREQAATAVSCSPVTPPCSPARRRAASPRAGLRHEVRADEAAPHEERLPPPTTVAG